jgi:hypothetical protein
MVPTDCFKPELQAEVRRDESITFESNLRVLAVH